MAPTWSHSSRACNTLSQEGSTRTQRPNNRRVLVRHHPAARRFDAPMQLDDPRPHVLERRGPDGTDDPRFVELDRPRAIANGGREQEDPRRSHGGQHPQECREVGHGSNPRDECPGALGVGQNGDGLLTEREQPAAATTERGGAAADDLFDGRHHAERRPESTPG